MRRDQLESGTVNIGQVQNGILPASDFPILKSYTPKRNTLMFDYSPSEFSRFRLQYARDQSRPDGVDDNELMLQYIFSMGAHGAHKF